MPECELDLLSIERGTVAAPAGCGKTHLIFDALTRLPPGKPALILTHTNAGVAALRTRFERAGIAPKQYRLSTIDGWIMRLIAAFPARSGHATKVLELGSPSSDYPAIRKAALELLKPGHLRDILPATYSRLIVDEYQDCSLIQHAIVYYAAVDLPICVLGDPLQTIFDFNDAMAEWDGHVCKHFPFAGELTIPWRWKNAGEEEFGRWLLEVRRDLIAGKPIDLRAAHPNVTWIPLTGTGDHEVRLRACRVSSPNTGGSVLIIGESTNPQSQQQIASQTPGAVVIENVDLRDLVRFAKDLDLRAGNALGQVLKFAQSVMTNIGTSDFAARIVSLSRNTARREATSAESCALRFVATPTLSGVRDLLGELGQQAGVNNHRPIILQGCIRALRVAEQPNGPTFHEAAIRVREQARVLSRPLPRRAVGSTLLLKGLEADVAVILNARTLNRRNLYVAMTRGARRLIICSEDPVLRPT